MARKNLIEISAPNPERMDAVAPRDNRPIAGFVPQERSAAPVGGITKTLGNITEKMERASELERQLATGQTIVELDPGLIDASFVSDRLAIDAAELAQLVEQIREHGQQVPILVRPHPETRGRYQVAYGHRRLAAAREIGIRVRAVVRDLTDGQLVVSQGQENSARTNLSYIERALFASRLEERSFGRDVIMAALGVDKAALSRMLIVIRQVPLRLVNAIGAAPDIGRRRWLELGERLEKADVEKIIAELSADDTRKISSDERFQRALVLATKKTAAPKPAVAKTQVTGVPVMIKKTVSGATFVFDGKIAPGFDQFVQERLKGLFQEFNKDRGA
ncbi:plasmid partitioning protein RepB (plasmid) [Rhizobium leguminosarum]|jgi:ParB family chromosome partitioning protein|uniref:Plasmid partitioning protein n=2 Tax=Rhizobium leguminosarum TaxID=384 RepID=A0A1B8R8M5_RHILT|nr:plasmid partitioning protein RepB [Rhizobium leguminosarum]AOO92067.1 plasmid partitioning protein [Rhizobium leguminosarum bv. trifolii]ASS58585.1 plasmid partitioning protein RepB [Rhizobium leguminosarum bv. viciae]AVC47302.1 plasmid partitioning protein RepB [Rhizobium leguminosarum bv. viciae]MBB4332258.1 ParB family chromosome partitioning protein [Rhizobium leguminosarum]MBB4342772.1 ParB family chromosome partitioning protein [Rhizobium leguminosarum]